MRNDLEVSNLGRVRSFAASSEGRIRKLSPGPGGYRAVCYVDIDAGVRKSLRVHKGVALAFVPNPDNKPFVNHIDGVWTNNRASNLEWVTPKENAVHARLTLDWEHVVPRGETHPKAKLNPGKVGEIRLLAKSISLRAIGRMYGVSHQSISAIIYGKNWKEVK